MKPTKEQIEAYNSMAKQSPQTMESIIRANLEESCQKFKGNEDKFDRCIQHLRDTVLEMLGGRNAAKNNQLSGHVPAETCFRICQDYFNDEVWKAEDEEEAKKKSEQEEKKRKESEKRSKAAQGKKYPKTVSISASVDDVESECDNEEDEDVVDKDLEDRYDLKAEPKTCEGQLDMFAMLGV